MTSFDEGAESPDQLSTTTLRLSQLPPAARVQEAHRVARAKGWWPTLQGRSYLDFTKSDDQELVDEKLLLIGSEIAEALECVRDHKRVGEIWVGEKGKPEGILVELADVEIRILDLIGGMGLHEVYTGGLETAARQLRLEGAGLPERVTAQLYWVQQPIGRPGLVANNLAAVMARLHAFVRHHGGEELLDRYHDILDQKHAFNQGRPARHGGRAA